MNKAIINKAERFCEENKINDYPVKIVDICEGLGLSVFEEYLPSDVSGLILVQDEDFKDYGTGKLIVVNAGESAQRRRFTIAHELAHFILHKKGAELYAHRDTVQTDHFNPIESEANEFASNILMPEPLVKKAIQEVGPLWREAPDARKIEYIASKFAVSAKAAAVRLSQLGYVF